jgi:hypothetical protein
MSLESGCDGNDRGSWVGLYRRRRVREPKGERESLNCGVVCRV